MNGTVIKRPLCVFHGCRRAKIRLDGSMDRRTAMIPSVKEAFMKSLLVSTILIVGREGPCFLFLSFPLRTLSLSRQSPI